MQMPGRHGFATESGDWHGSYGYYLPDYVSVNFRNNNKPPEYTARIQVALENGFSTGAGSDNYVAYIADSAMQATADSAYQLVANGYRYGFNGKEKDDEVKGEGNAYNFGDRIEDPRVGGRWFSIDPYTKKIPGESPYIYASNSPILFIDYQGKYKIAIHSSVSKDISMQKISNFVDVVKNMHSYLLQHRDIVGRLSSATGLSRERILEYSSYGKGPTLMIGDFKNSEVEESDFKNKQIKIRLKDVLAFENANGKDKQIYKLASIILINHEFTHYGDREINGGKISGQSDGDLPEGKQVEKKSLLDHRGTDVEDYMLISKDKFNKGTDGNRGTGTLEKTEAGIGRTNEGTLTPKDKAKVKNSHLYEGQQQTTH